MNPMSKRFAPLVLLALPMLARGEDYIAKIYGVPAGWTVMRSYGGGDNQMMSGYVEKDGIMHAAYLTSTGGFKDMHPSSFTWSLINDSWGSTYHCGYGLAGSSIHALFWVGGGVPVDMHPSLEYDHSYLFGGSGTMQVGLVAGTIACPDCGFTSSTHAGTWSRTAASFRRLHSTTHRDTRSWGTNGTQFVGFGTNRADGSTNALLWKTVGGFSTNLRPSMSTESRATTVWGNQQGGYFVGPQTGGYEHAVIWAGTAGSAVDLNPNATFQRSTVVAVRNGLQVGWARPLGHPTRSQAIAWHGTSGTWINLHSRLAYPYNLGESFAEGIDNQGNIIGYIMGTFGMRPVVWLRV
jgi:hypothetical protein